MKNLIALNKRMEDIDSLGVVFGGGFRNLGVALEANLAKIKKSNEKSSCFAGQISGD